MKKILGTIFLVCSVFILGIAQHEQQQHAPQGTAIISSLVLQDSTKKELNGIISNFYSQGDSASLNLAIINVPPPVQEIKEEPKEHFLSKTYFTWWKFFLSILFFFGLYFFLKFLSQVLNKYNFLGKFQSDVKRIVTHSLLIYEAIALLILGGAFVLINPISHGILTLLILAAGFSHVRNYFSGRIVQFDQSVEEGKRLKTLDSQGVIFKKGRLGLKLRTQKGVQFINYSSLISEGYILLSGEEVGGFYELVIQPLDLEEKKDYFTFLSDLFTTAPYLDLKHRPQLETINDETKTFLARVEVKEESHLQDLISLIKERNFSCKVNS